MQLVVHSPFGSRLNRAWGLALRKRFCRTFNFELQAAATEDAIVLSLSTSHSFPLDEVARYLHSATALDVLVQALLDAPLFGVRWRWNATTALALPRFVGGRKVAPQLQRMKAEDLLAAVFPDQVACAENLVGEREIPDHPLVAQTLRDCLDEAMDARRLAARCCAGSRSGEVEVRRARPPRALAARGRSAERAALRLPRRRAARGAPHAGGAEPALRRSRERPTISASLDAGGDRRRARGGVAAGAQRRRDARGAELRSAAIARRRGGAAGRLGGMARRARAGRARDAPRIRSADRRRRLWVAAERLAPLQALHPPAPLQPADRGAGRVRREVGDDARRRAARAAALAPRRPRADRRPKRSPRRSACRPSEIEAALLQLQAEGYVLHGRFIRACRRRAARVVRAPPARAHPSLHAASGCAARSSRSSRATSCASCSTGSTSRPPAASAGRTRWPACWRSSKASRRRRRRGKASCCRRA